MKLYARRPALKKLSSRTRSRGFARTGVRDLLLPFLPGALFVCSYRRRPEGAIDAALTVSFRPMARVTAASVDKRGLPRGDSARYRLSRSIPAALATLATPCACARCRSASNRTRGSSVSSRAAFRYSAANFASLRSRRTSASSWLALAFRFSGMGPILG